ncbi:unnamed protein product [Moneuplotes crassus]|uniref:Uncharacterized protein n=1 Tax=Euplotes crassus TaxID=5936 RepID=A0AAD1XIT8_EUPCR|nr:unnamed protein product [Moneuplotes crassus]
MIQQKRVQQMNPVEMQQQMGSRPVENSQIHIQQKMREAMDRMERYSTKLNMVLYKRKKFHEKRREKLNQYEASKGASVQKEQELQSLVEHYGVVKEGIKNCGIIFECLKFLEDMMTPQSARMRREPH